MKKSIAMFIAAVLVASVGIAQTLTVSPVELAASGTILSGATAASATVYNSGTGTSYYTVSVPTSQTWMSVSPATGSSTGDFDTITVTYTTTNQTAGIHTNDITITQTNATVTVKTIPVTLTIEEDLNAGVVLGPSSVATAASGIAIGDRTGRAIAVGANTIQIGGGVNSSAGTTAIRSYQLLTSAGLIAAARLSGVVMNGGAITNVRASILTGLYQSDTNVTTTATKYTPTFIGQILLGGAGSDTNAVWISKGVTTNDWVRTTP